MSLLAQIPLGGEKLLYWQEEQHGALDSSFHLLTYLTHSHWETSKC